MAFAFTVGSFGGSLEELDEHWESELRREQQRTREKMAELRRPLSMKEEPLQQLSQVLREKELATAKMRK